MKMLNLFDGQVKEYMIPSFKMLDTFLKKEKIRIPDQREILLTGYLVEVIL